MIMNWFERESVVYLSDVAGIKVIGEANSGEEAIKIGERKAPECRINGCQNAGHWGT